MPASSKISPHPLPPYHKKGLHWVQGDLLITLQRLILHCAGRPCAKHTCEAEFHNYAAGTSCPCMFFFSTTCALKESTRQLLPCRMLLCIGEHLFRNSLRCCLQQHFYFSHKVSIWLPLLTSSKKVFASGAVKIGCGHTLPSNPIPSLCPPLAS